MSYLGRTKMEREQGERNTQEPLPRHSSGVFKEVRPHLESAGEKKPISKGKGISFKRGEGKGIHGAQGVKREACNRLNPRMASGNKSPL